MTAKASFLGLRNLDILYLTVRLFINDIVKQLYVSKSNSGYPEFDQEKTSSAMLQFAFRGCSHM
jgi:hypothetical protein